MTARAAAGASPRGSAPPPQAKAPRTSKAANRERAGGPPAAERLGQRPPPKGDAAQDEKGGNQGGEGRPPGAGGDRIGDPRARAGPRRDQSEPVSQRQRRAEREQLEGDQHHRADQSGEV